MTTGNKKVDEHYNVECSRSSDINEHLQWTGSVKKK